MAILRERKVWRRFRPESPRRPVQLSPDEQANVRRALLFLRARMGTWRLLAKAMGLGFDMVSRCNKRGRPISTGIAIRTARFAGVPLEDILAGKWPVPGACPTCGR